MSRDESTAAGQASASMTPDRLAVVLRRAGAQHVTAAEIRADIEAGAPVNADGSVNLVAYTAWLVREVARGS